MNKFINILLLLILFPTVGYTLIVGFDFPLEFLKISGNNLPYKLETFAVFAGIIFTVGLRRSLRRWMGVKMITQLHKFQWSAPMSKERYKQGSMYLYLEAFTHLAAAYGVYYVTPLSWPVSLALCILAFDHVLFAFLGNQKKWFRVGMTSKAILVADRDLKAVYFTGLRSVDKQAQTLFFDYIKDFQVAFPADCIEENQKEAFKQQLEKNIDRDSVFFTEAFKAF